MCTVTPLEAHTCMEKKSVKTLQVPIIPPTQNVIHLVEYRTVCAAYVGLHLVCTLYMYMSLTIPTNKNLNSEQMAESTQSSNLPQLLSGMVRSSMSKSNVKDLRNECKTVNKYET